MSNDRKVMVREDRDGKIFVKYRTFHDQHLIIRPDSSLDVGNHVFKKGDKVRVLCINERRGFFSIIMQKDSEKRDVWGGACWDQIKGEWIGEQLKI